MLDQVVKQEDKEKAVDADTKDLDDKDRNVLQIAHAIPVFITFIKCLR